jgi:beta-aspartyl-peptidase (threonine type)
MKNTLLILVALVCLSAAAIGQTRQQKAQAVADILGVMDAQVAAWNRGDIEGFMKGYWNSPKLAFVSGDNITRGWQSTLDRYKKNYDSKAKMGTLEFREVEVNVLSPDAAVVLGSWHLAREKDEPHGKFSLVFRKMADGWRIVIDHTS